MDDGGWTDAGWWMQARREHSVGRYSALWLVCAHLMSLCRLIPAGLEWESDLAPAFEANAGASEIVGLLSNILSGQSCKDKAVGGCNMLQRLRGALVQRLMG